MISLQNDLNEEVWLCWKYGETEIKFWHEKDSGFMGRKPIEVSDDSSSLIILNRVHF